MALLIRLRGTVASKMIFIPVKPILKLTPKIGVDILFGKDQMLFFSDFEFLNLIIR